MYHITCQWGIGNKVSKEESYNFSSKEDRDKQIQEFFRKKINEGYHVLYMYPHNLFASTDFKIA